MGDNGDIMEKYHGDTLIHGKSMGYKWIFWQYGCGKTNHKPTGWCVAPIKE